jgi:precorrin-6B C5,15-methyltransferase / cobalt-precorrin-6B C5,C15-methyltransferase
MITVIGLDGSPLSPEAAKTIAAASLVVGGRRHLSAAGQSPAGPAAAGPAAPGPAAQLMAGPRTVTLGPLQPALDALAAHEGDAVVLASGDPGFFGIVRALRERGLACAVWPAVSSVALAFARAGLPWDDAVVVSAHGRDLRRAVNMCRAHPKVAVLTAPGQGPAEVGAALAGWPRRLLVAEALGTPEERITECFPADAAERDWTDPNVVLVLAGEAEAPPTADAPPPADGTAPADSPNVIMRSLWPEQQQSHDHEAGHRTGPPRNPLSHASHRMGWRWPRSAPDADDAGWALPEEAFEHRDSMLTKAEVRAVALARLGPRPGLLVWDVGAGSGSVGVECARLGAAVIAVDCDPAQCARVASNAARHQVDIRVISGAAPEALNGLPDPDAVFIGGGGTDVVSAVAARRPARIVVALAAVERAGPVCDVLDAAGYLADGTLLQSSRLARLPDGTHRLAATNPVFLLWSTTTNHDRGQLGRQVTQTDHDHGSHQPREPEQWGG